MPIPNEADEMNPPHSHSAQNSGVSNKNSKARFSMPVYSTNQAQPGLFSQQGNYYQNQDMYNNQYSSNNLFNVPDESHQMRNETNLRDIINLPGQGSKNNQNKGLGNNYQPNLYQNTNVPMAHEQPKQPYKFAAQPNFNNKKISPTNNDNIENVPNPRMGQFSVDKGNINKLSFY